MVSADISVATRLAWRAKFWWYAVWLILVLAIIVPLAGQFSGRQPATVALDIGMSFIRLVIPVFVALIVQETLSKEFERKYYNYSLSYPRSRYSMLLGRLLAAYGMGIALTIVMALVLTLMVLVVKAGYDQERSVALGWGYVLTWLFIALDFFVLTVFSVLLAVVASTPGFVLIGTIGFMLVARSYSPIIQLLNSSAQIVAHPETYSESLRVLSYFIPDLGALDIRPLVLYSDRAFLPMAWPYLVISAFLYALLLLALALALFGKKRLD